MRIIEYIKSRLSDLTFWIGAIAVLAEFTVHLNDFSPLMVFIYGLIAALPPRTLTAASAWLATRVRDFIDDTI